MANQNPDKPTKTTVRDIIGADAIESILNEVREENPKYLLCIWIEGEDDTLRWHSNTMRDSMFVYLLERAKFEFMEQDSE